MTFQILKEQYLNQELDVCWINNELVSICLGDDIVDLPEGVIKYILDNGQYKQSKYCRKPSELNIYTHKINASTNENNVIIKESVRCDLFPQEVNTVVTLSKSKLQEIYDLVQARIAND